MDGYNLYDFNVKAYYPNLNAAIFLIKNDQKKNHVFLNNYFLPEIEYLEKKNTQPKTLTAHFLDTPYLLQEDKEKKRKFILQLLNAEKGSVESKKFIETLRNKYKKEKVNELDKLRVTENDYVIPSLTKDRPDESLISQKASILLDLVQELYPVPDFSILTSKAYTLNEEERNIHLEDAISNLERMTGSKLGDSENPLIFAMRCATSCYIPGLFPTYLNVGVNEKVHGALKKIYGIATAGKIYLSNLQTIYKILFPDDLNSELCKPISSYYSIADIDQNIHSLRSTIERYNKRILTDLFYQISFLVKNANDFFQSNQELIHTLKKGDISYPAYILQKMVWTIRNDDSYPGVLYSRHSRTGLGMQIESVRNAFGDDIMTGNIERTDFEFFSEKEIMISYPAVYHFAPQLAKLEKKYKSPVTIEFAAESYKNTHLFAILQLNISQLTGRATLLSSIDLFKKKIINSERVINLLQPYHLRQIFSERIDDKSFRKLKFFCRGISVLPRSAVTSRIFFSASKALTAKSKGDKVCLCKDAFIPADTVVLKELDAIISLTPAAVHVVTACLGQGIPAIINLQRYMVKIEQHKLVNNNDNVIKEGDWITISSKHRMIFTGKAVYSPARFNKYLEGHKLVLLPKEEIVFTNMKEAYLEYQNILKNLEDIEIITLYDLIKIIRNDLQKYPERAEKIVNNWFDANTNLYIEQILKSELGTHQDQHMIYEYLTIERKITFFKNAIKTCKKRNIRGFTAGSFMLGRFICLPHPIKFWINLEKWEIAIILNEYILFEKYLQVLNDLGERHISHVKTEILREGIGNINLSHIEPKVFMTLKLCFKDWASLEENCTSDFDIETMNLLNLLKNPFGYFYDYNSEWSLSRLKEICNKENLPLPGEMMM